MEKLSVHAFCYAVLLAAVMAVIPLQSSFGGDDGAYGGQVYALQQGAWTLDRPLPVVAQENEGWLNTTITPDGPTPYSANPFYAMLLKAAADLVPGGDDGRAAGNSFALQLVPVAGALAASVVAWLLAAQWVPARRSLLHPPAVAFWLVGLGPVLVNSTTLWAHTLSSALGGLALLALVKAASTRSTSSATGDSRGGLGPAIGWFGVLLGALTLSALIRTEAIFWIMAIGLTATVVIRTRTAFLGAGMACSVAATGWLLNRSWGQSLRADKVPVETSIEAMQPNSGWLESRLPAAWRLLMTSVSSGIGPFLSLVAITLALVAAFKIRTAATPEQAVASRSSVTVLLLASVGLYAAQVVLAPGDLISGTIAAWPVAVILLLAPAARSDEDLAVLLVPSGLLLAAVLATQYSVSGGLQWGGRYLSMAFVPLAVAAAVHGRQVLADYQRPLAALLVAPAIVGVVASYQLHSKHQHVVETTTAEPAEVVITEIHALPRIAWTELPTAFYVASEDDVEALLMDLARSEVQSVNVQGFDEITLDGTGGYRQTTATTEIRHFELGS